VRVGGLFISALYQNHPPRSLYTADLLLDYVEACLEELNRDFPAALVILAGDFNQLTELRCY